MKFLVVCSVILISGCSIVTSSIKNRMTSDVMTAISDSSVGYGTLQCRKVGASCPVGGDYTEWELKDGTLGCSCNS